MKVQEIVAKSWGEHFQDFKDRLKSKLFHTKFTPEKPKTKLQAIKHFNSSSPTKPSSVSSLLQESKKMLMAPVKSKAEAPKSISNKPPITRIKKPVAVRYRCHKGFRKDRKTNKCTRYIKGSVSSIISGC